MFRETIGIRVIFNLILNKWKILEIKIYHTTYIYPTILEKMENSGFF